MCKFFNKLLQVLDCWHYPIGESKKRYFARFYSVTEQTATDVRIHLYNAIGGQFRTEWYDIDGSHVLENEIAHDPFLINIFQVVLGTADTKPINVYVETDSDNVPQISWNVDGNIISPYDMQLI